MQLAPRPILEHSITPKRNLLPFSSPPTFPPHPPDPRQPPVQCCPWRVAWALRVNGVTRYVVCCDWLLPLGACSGSVRVVAHVRTSFLLLPGKTHCAGTPTAFCLLPPRGPVGLLSLSDYCEQRCAHLWKSFCVSTFSFLLGVNQERGCWAVW